MDKSSAENAAIHENPVLEVHIFHRHIPLVIVIGMLFVAGFIGIEAILSYAAATQRAIELVVRAGNGTEPTFVYGSWPALDKVEFYNRVLAELIDKKATFIRADLSQMKLTYYKDGTVADEAQILSKGRPGSWWETPTGFYKVVEKVPSDFSSFAHVYSPWALAFQGNFLIHGWPYYPDGTPVASTYSGGCIRLSTDDAEKLYDMVAVNTPVLVSSENFTADDFREIPQGPPLDAPAFLAADLKSNFVFAAKNPNAQYPIASITKLMTALVAVEYVNIEKTITITPDMVATTSIPRLKVGKTYSLYDLLQPLLKESSNEAALAISKFLGTNYFVSVMNQTARSIGMNDTRFTDPAGSNWSNVSTPHDLFLFAQYLYNNRSFILDMTTNDKSPNVYGPSAFPNLENFNVFAAEKSFVGGKVGINGGASGTILSIFIEPFAPDASSTASSTMMRPYMFTILGSQNYETEAQKFHSWIQSAYE